MTALTFYFVTHSVRVIMRGDEPWFILRDLLEAMQSKTTTTAAIESIEQGLGKGFVNDIPLQTAGGIQNIIIIAEPAATYLLSRSNTEKGRKLNRFIHIEVLPAIRKTGRYEAPAPVPVRKPIRSRADLSFTALDAQGRLQNWVVPHVPGGNWHRGVDVGRAYFAEVLELAQHSRKEAYWALQTALVDGAATQWPSGGWGIECGFAEAIATALFPPEPPRLTRRKAP
jgi:prophage antirepressor-like protein